MRQSLNVNIVWVIVTTLLFLSGPVQAASDFVPELQPSPQYLPEEVVGIQMRALGSNDRPFTDAGIKLTFRFASPLNKVNTGPLTKFSKLFASPAYEPMLNHRKLKIGDAKVELDTAIVPVYVETANGGRAGYLFVLGKQTIDPFMDCWMTNSVMPVRLTDPGGITFM